LGELGVTDPDLTRDVKGKEGSPLGSMAS